MLKVFLVEDECVVREGLRECIDWARYGFEFCGDAPDGELALPQIRKLRPDILITEDRRGTRAEGLSAPLPAGRAGV